MTYRIKWKELGGIDMIVEHMRDTTAKYHIRFGAFGDDYGFADHCADIEFENDRWKYNAGGHGIGTRMKRFQKWDELISCVIEDNERWNSTDLIHIAVTPLANKTPDPIAKGRSRVHGDRSA